MPTFHTLTIATFDTLDPFVHCIEEWAPVVLPDVAIFRVVEHCSTFFGVLFGLVDSIS